MCEMNNNLAKDAPVPLLSSQCLMTVVVRISFRDETSDWTGWLDWKGKGLVLLKG